MNRKQIIFIVFTMSFAVVLAIVLAAMKNEPAVDTESSDTPTESSKVPSLISEPQSGGESETSDIIYVSSQSGDEWSNNTSDDMSSEASESSEPPIEPENLPYAPDGLMALRPDDITHSELDRFFDNSVFIGNSLMMDFYNYTAVRRRSVPDFLGDAKFFCTYGYSAYLDLEGDKKYWPTYRGEAMHTWEAVSAMDVDTVYYNLMGLTELWKYSYNTSPEKTFESNRKVIEKIREANPGCRIVLLSSSYMAYSFNRSDRALNNYLISRFNSIALEWCEQNGCDFIDISTPFLYGDSMPDEYCRDPGEKGQGCHIKSEYYSAWAATLRNYAYLKTRGTWQNPDEMQILNAHK